MRRIPGFVFDWVPPSVLALGHLLRTTAKYPKYRSLIRANKTVKNVMRGKAVVVVANGPSLRRMDWQPYGGMDAIVMNLIHKSLPPADLNIVAHCFGEPKSSPGWFLEEIVESINKVPAEMHWVHYSTIADLCGVQSGKKIYGAYPGVEASLWRGSQIQLDTVSLGYVTTAQLAIQVAMHLGYARVVLVGFDHDWLASPKYLGHFYSDSKDDSDRLAEFSYRDILRFMSRMWDLYYAIDASARRAGVEIRNATDGGHLDVFQRITGTEIPFFLAQCNRRQVS